MKTIDNYLQHHDNIATIVFVLALVISLGILFLTNYLSY